MSAKMAQMRAELETLSEFKTLRVKLMDERKYYEERLLMQKELKEKLAEIRHISCEEAAKRLDELTKHVFAENKQYDQRLRGHLETVRELEKLRQEAERRSKELSEENIVLSDQVAAFAARGVEQRKAISEARGAIGELRTENEKAAAEIQRREAELVALRQELETIRANGGADAGETRRRLEVTTNEFAKAKKVADQLRRERTQIDRFFVDCIAEARRGIKEQEESERKAERAEFDKSMREATASGTAFPKIRTFGKSTSAGSTPDSTNLTLTLADISKIEDLSVLTWKEREQILRSLFQRIRAARRIAAGCARCMGTILPERPATEPRSSETTQRVLELPSLIPENLRTPTDSPRDDDGADVDAVVGAMSEPAMPPVI
eukprot:m51a1_g9648 hypothetical protein (380) ;mRNA; r:1174810-1176181